MNCELISNHIGRKCVACLIQLKRSNVKFKLISDIMAHWYAINTIIFAIKFCNAYKSNCALMFFMRNK